MDDRGRVLEHTPAPPTSRVLPGGPGGGKHVPKPGLAPPRVKSCEVANRVGYSSGHKVHERPARRYLLDHDFFGGAGGVEAILVRTLARGIDAAGRMGPGSAGPVSEGPQTSRSRSGRRRMSGNSPWSMQGKPATLRVAISQHRICRSRRPRGDSRNFAGDPTPVCCCRVEQEPYRPRAASQAARSSSGSGSSRHRHYRDDRAVIGCHGDRATR